MEEKSCFRTSFMQMLWQILFYFVMLLACLYYLFVYLFRATQCAIHLRVLRLGFSFSFWVIFHRWGISTGNLRNQDYSLSILWIFLRYEELWSHYRILLLLPLKFSLRDALFEAERKVFASTPLCQKNGSVCSRKKVRIFLKESLNIWQFLLNLRILQTWSLWSFLWEKSSTALQNKLWKTSVNNRSTHREERNFLKI